MALFFQRVNSPCHHKLINAKFDPCQFWLDSPFKETYRDFYVDTFRDMERTKAYCIIFLHSTIHRV
jgi:hypothetical protein